MPDHTNVNTYKLEKFQLFKFLTDSELMLLERNSVQKTYKKGSVIYREGERHSGIYIIQKGIVKIFKIGANGRQQIFRFGQKGDIVAYRSLLSNELACTSAVAYNELVVSYIPYVILLELLEQNWKFTLEIMKMMCKELGVSNSFVTDIAQKTIRERTAEMLLILKDEFGVDARGMLKIAITRLDLAGLVGTVTESLIRVLSEFKYEGLLDLPGRKIVFLDTTKLSIIANL